MSIRLNKLIAWRGVAARRKADQLISDGQVKVNGVVVRELGTMVDEQVDRIMVMGRPLPPPQRMRWFMLHKPVGIISTVADPEGRRTVRDLLPTGARVFPVGRLDADTSGLLLLTNDGPLAHKLMHPRYGVEKIYRVRLAAPPESHQLRRLAQGVRFDVGMVSAPAQVRQIDPGFDAIMIEIRIHEGRFRQVRRMCEAVGLEVTGLHRVAYGPLRLGPLPRGEHRELTPDEVAMLRNVSARPQARPARARGGRAADEAKRRALYMHGTDPDPAPADPSREPERGRARPSRDERPGRDAWRTPAAAAPPARGRHAPSAEEPEDVEEFEERWGPGAGGGEEDRFEPNWPARPSGKRGDADFVAGPRSAPGERFARNDRPMPVERASRAQQPARGTRPARSERPERSLRPARDAKPSRAARPSRDARPAREAQGSRPGRAERSMRPQPASRASRSDRPSRASGPGRSTRPARPAATDRAERRGSPLARARGGAAPRERDARSLAGRGGSPSRGRPSAMPRGRSADAPRGRRPADAPRGRRPEPAPRGRRSEPESRGSTQRADRRGPARPHRGRDATRRASARPSGGAPKRGGGSSANQRRRKG